MIVGHVLGTQVSRRCGFAVDGRATSKISLIFFLWMGLLLADESIRYNLSISVLPRHSFRSFEGSTAATGDPLIDFTGRYQW
jgi:hypothetical protein